MSPDQRGLLGRRGEELAADFLRQRGHVIVERNYRNKFGEIDIITRDGDTLVFVEVKTRKSQRYGGAAAAVTAKKQRQITMVALEYMASQPRQTATRCDVVCVIIDTVGQIQLSLIENAFEAAL
ncbi:MAG: YraN family protein [Desulfobulbaceae bacterium]|jgi:putative endonuclease|nr:YraN family protein [Desulfobulbaceae bacterium]